MSEYGALSTNGTGAGAGIKKDAFADAVQRARQVIAWWSGDGGADLSK